VSGEFLVPKHIDHCCHSKCH